ncbi:MAG TPA: hypothetical protein VND20_10185 [Candidatus Binataceae bacterium]|nr:hypothetical protein [Candidatus Binataceae bacterium]
METELIEIEMIEDRSSLAAMSAKARSNGAELVCRRCANAEEVIAGVLVMMEGSEIWALCGPCWRQLPQGSYIV